LSQQFLAMEDFANILQKDYGLKPQGKATPMATLGSGTVVVNNRAGSSSFERAGVMGLDLLTPVKLAPRRMVGEGRRMTLFSGELMAFLSLLVTVQTLPSSSGVHLTKSIVARPSKFPASFFDAPSAGQFLSLLWSVPLELSLLPCIGVLAGQNTLVRSQWRMSW
jgi:hypothetical protein